MGAMETSLKTFERPSTASRESSEFERPAHLNKLEIRDLAEHIPQPVWVVALNGHGEYFNTYWGSYTGLSAEESFDFGWSRAIHAEDLGNFMKLLRTSARSVNWECEARLRRGADGSYRRHLCQCSALASQSKGIVRVLVCCTDVEEWRQAEASAREQAQLLGSCVRGHDQEKRKIAHVLHDSAGQYLVALQMKLDGLQRSSIGSTGRKNSIVEECQELLKRCSRELRATSYLLYPPLLDDLGLESAVRLHVDGLMERTRAKIELDIEPNLGRLDRDLEIALFRVAQEALASIFRQSARQSGSKEAEVKIGASPTSVVVEVRGSGMGSQPDKFTAGWNATSALSVAALRQRILEAGGVFEIEALPGGTVVRAAVPRKALIAHACD
jgi:PAS domain S-box-containing protein